MLCRRCASLIPERRKAARGFSLGRGPLVRPRALPLCEGCAAVARCEDLERGILDTLSRLGRFGLGGAVGPLLGSPPRPGRHR